ncbi:hypothetical protein ACL03H_00790 [Saccharopolyspora sp. MS10]|uniref:hypothetical protein n=1 Tax=Saccharopolyspora sp. MS10 TaxID=3385973 RepID=UPI0039A00AFF
MAEELTGLDYWLSLDDWQDTDYADWTKLDAYVEMGWMTEQDRDYVQAAGSMAAMNQSGGGFPEVDAAWSKYLDVKDEHAGDPMFNSSAGAEEIPPPDYDSTMEEGVDYDQDTPFDIEGMEETPVADVPDVPGDEGEGKTGDGVVAVNTRALEVFADNVDSLRRMIADSKVKTDEVNILPGGFHAAYVIRDEIMGDGGSRPGLKNDVRFYLDKLEIALENVRDEVRKLVVDYDNTEDLNALTTDKLNGIMNESFGYINSSSQATPTA